MASGFALDDRELRSSLKTMNARADAYLSRIVNGRAEFSQEFMRENAPWQDHSGDARAGLVAEPITTYPSYAIVLAHTVAYGIFLELRESGKFEIIRPTVDTQGDELMKDAALMWAALLGRGAT